LWMGGTTLLRRRFDLRHFVTTLNSTLRWTSGGRAGVVFRLARGTKVKPGTVTVGGAVGVHMQGTDAGLLVWCNGTKRWQRTQGPASAPETDSTDRPSLLSPRIGHQESKQQKKSTRAGSEWTIVGGSSLGPAGDRLVPSGIARMGTGHRPRHTKMG
jgi:hypothetical protein